jgi:erythromycin esterase
VPGFPVRPGIWRLHGIEPTLPTDDLEPLRGMIGNAPVVGLGESFHTSGGFYVLKHRIFRFLVEQMGFRAFAIESSWTGADDAARYVETCEGAPERAIARHVNVWQSTEYADLVQWMCEWNRDHPDPADKLSLFGFDVQQPQEDAQNLIGFLRQLAAEEDHPWISGMRSCEGVTASHPFGEVPQDSHDRCLQALSAVEKHVERNRDVLLRRFTEQDLALVLLHLVGLRAWEEQVFRIAHDFAAGYSARDAGMAYAFLTLRAMRAPEARTVIWAANSHLARNRLPNGASPLGSHLAAALGRGYVSFALTAYETEIDFPGFGCGPVAPLPGSVESRLHALGEDALLMDLSRSPFLRSGLYPMGIDRLRPRKDYNGLIYLERSDRMHPLVWEPCR